RIYEISTRQDAYIQEFKDDATAFNGLKKDQIREKGEINTEISATIFKYLESKGIPTHFIEMLSPNEMLVNRVKIIKVEVVCRNIAAGSLVKRYGFKEGTEINPAIVEYYLKSDELGDPLFNEAHIYALKLATEEELKNIKDLTLKINDLLKEYFSERKIKLVDFKLEFGKDKDNNILLSDEISPDTCRLWDAETNKKLDKDRFRFDLGEVEESYKEIRNRIRD
ncbi:MAG TPA: phosphoribosylaminoimidazolesuccinocarboxamide synthase, partial [Ignavibacteria bacterium]